MLSMGDLMPQGKGAIIGGNVAAHCKVMENSMLSGVKTAEPIEMPFWLKTRLGPRNHVLDGAADPQGEGAIYGGCSGYLKALAIFAAAVSAAFAANGIIQSPITSCSRRDHSVCQASANSILIISGRWRCGLSASKGVL